MAKKKKANDDIMFRYKNRRATHKQNIHNDWLPCNEETKVRLEKSYPNYFVFEQTSKEKPPKPTPSMENFTESEENKDK